MDDIREATIDLFYLLRKVIRDDMCLAKLASKYNTDVAKLELKINSCNSFCFVYNWHTLTFKINIWRDSREDEEPLYIYADNTDIDYLPQDFSSFINLANKALKIIVDKIRRVSAGIEARETKELKGTGQSAYDNLAARISN